VAADAFAWAWDCAMRVPMLPLRAVVAGDAAALTGEAATAEAGMNGAALPALARLPVAPLPAVAVRLCGRDDAALVVDACEE